MSDEPATDPSPPPSEAATAPPGEAAGAASPRELLARLRRKGLDPAGLLRSLSEEEARDDLRSLLAAAADLVAEAQADLPQEAATLPPGDPVPKSAPQVSGFEVLGLLGEGGMGVVYRARQLGLGRTVALKMLRVGDLAGPQARARFRAEAEAVARLRHPNIVQIHAVGEHEGGPFFALELVEGGSLAARLGEAPMDPRQAAELVEQVARGVQHAHEQGVVHRDLKPENVLLTEDGSPKITDFGLAKMVEADVGHTRTGEVMGTPSYMAPEQAAGEVKKIGPATDIYALGALLYRLLVGRPPFRGDTPLDTILQVIDRAPQPVREANPSCPRDLHVICMRCLRKEPDRRYPSAGALADDLARYLRGDAIRARPERPEERLVRWVKRNPMPAALRFTAGVAVVGMLGFTFLGWFGYLAFVDDWLFSLHGVPFLALASGLCVFAAAAWARGKPTVLAAVVLAVLTGLAFVWMFENSSSGRPPFPPRGPNYGITDKLDGLYAFLPPGMSRGLFSMVVVPVSALAVLFGALWHWGLLRAALGLLLALGLIGLFLVNTGGEGVGLLLLALLLGCLCRISAALLRGTRPDTVCGGLLGMGLGALILWVADPGSGLVGALLGLGCPILGAVIGALGSRQAAR